jgi:hypothetical protein
VRAGGIFALTVSALFAPACESILGIDGHYVIESGAMPTGGASGMSGGGGTGGLPDVPSSGGLLPPTGGAPPNGTGGALAEEDAGCDACATGDCRPGHYKGTFRGKHDPVGLAGISSFDVSGGIEFDVAADSKGRLLVSGSLALAQQPAPPVTQFKATIQGELDCGTAKLGAKLSGGKLVLVLLPAFDFEGSLSGSYDSTNQRLSGDWTENQTPAAQATGSGTWTAVWDRP